MADPLERIRAARLIKRFGSFTAVDNASFTVRKNEFFSILGPSGCGKTTTLRCIAGLEQPTSGEVHIGGCLVASPEKGVMVPPERRGTGMVFQNYAVWPHMTVEQNIAYPLKIAREQKGKIQSTVSRIIDLLKLSGLEKRYPAELSGGQQQRVALGRALVMNPEVMLLDEPLSNLDAKLREQMRFELKDLQRKTGIAILYVTHDQVEAMAMSDRVAVMNGGVIVQEGTPYEIYKSPATKFVADFIGTMNFLSCEVMEWREDLATLRLRNGSVVEIHASQVEPGRYSLAVRPEDLLLKGEGGLDCQVDVAIFFGNAVDYRVKLGEEILRVQTSPDNWFDQGEKAGLVIQRGILFPEFSH